MPPPPGKDFQGLAATMPHQPVESFPGGMNPKLFRGVYTCKPIGAKVREAYRSGRVRYFSSQLNTI